MILIFTIRSSLHVQLPTFETPTIHPVPPPDELVLVDELAPPMPPDELVLVDELAPPMPLDELAPVPLGGLEEGPQAAPSATAASPSAIHG
jgi:hypothetical protein